MRQRLPWFKHWAGSGTGSTLKKIKADCGLEGVGFFWEMNEWICTYEDRQNTPGVIEIPIRLFARDMRIRPLKAVRLLTVVGRHAHWEIEVVLTDGSALNLKQLSAKTPVELSQTFGGTGVQLKLKSPNWLKFQETGWQNRTRREKREERREKKEERKEIKNAPKEEKKAAVKPPPQSPPAPREVHFDLPEFDRPGYEPVFDTPPPKPKSGKPFKGFGPRIEGIVNFYRKAHSEKYGGEKLAVTDAQKASLKRILQALEDPEEVKKIITKYFAMDDPWFKTKAHDIRTLETNLTKIQSSNEKKKIVWAVSFDD